MRRGARRSVAWSVLCLLVLSGLPGCAEREPLTLDETLERADREYCRARVNCVERSGLPGDDDHDYSICISELPDTSNYEATYGAACAEALASFRFCQAAALESACGVDPTFSCLFEFAQWNACF